MALVESRGLSGLENLWFGGRVSIGSGNSELRFLLRRPGSHVNDVCERDGRGTRPGVGGLELGWSSVVESPLTFAWSDCRWSGRGSTLAEAALGMSIDNCSLALLPANFLNSSSGSSLPNLNVANFDLRFSTLFALSSPALRSCFSLDSDVAFGLCFCRTKGRNLDLRRLRGGGAGSSSSSVGAVVMMAGAKIFILSLTCHTQNHPRNELTGRNGGYRRHALGSLLACLCR